MVSRISGAPGTQGVNEFEVQRPGVFDIWLQKKDGEYDVTRKSFNIDVTESDLQQSNTVNMIASLDAAQPLMSDWNTFNPEPEVRQASSLTRIFLIALTLILIAEQALAYSSSYHQS